MDDPVGRGQRCLLQAGERRVEGDVAGGRSVDVEVTGGSVVADDGLLPVARTDLDAVLVGGAADQRCVDLDSLSAGL